MARVRPVCTRCLANRGRPHYGILGKHLPPLEGTIDWTGFIEALGEVGYIGPLNLEVAPVMDRADVSPVDGVKRALGAAARLLGRAAV